MSDDAGDAEERTPRPHWERRWKPNQRSITDQQLKAIVKMCPDLAGTAARLRQATHGDILSDYVASIERTLFNAVPVARRLEIWDPIEYMILCRRYA